VDVQAAAATKVELLESRELAVAEGAKVLEIEELEELGASRLVLT
jgi:hypothetical protein